MPIPSTEFHCQLIGESHAGEECWTRWYLENRWENKQNGLSPPCQPWQGTKPAQVLASLNGVPGKRGRLSLRACSQFDGSRRSDSKRRGSVGGKGANLGELTAGGLPVPPGFVITGEAYLDADWPSGNP
jgi:hypothetical protein